VIKIIAALCSLSSLANCHEQTVFDWDCWGGDLWRLTILHTCSCRTGIVFPCPFSPSSDGH
jgi:hypothetical protein